MLSLLVLQQGIYIHIPYCKQACNYCNFHFSTNLSTSTALIDAIVKESTLRCNYLMPLPVQTIYIGGGTPSILPIVALKKIIEALHKHFNLSQLQEFTVEFNPDDVDKQYLKQLQALGCNRLSIGIQSFFDQDLKFMNRAHNAQQAKNCIAIAQDAGFTNISADLIYGYPSLRDENFITNLDILTGAQVNHLSCYNITVEEKTKLAHDIAQKRTADVNPEDGARQFNLLMQYAQQHNYEHYEISSFAKHGARAIHNSNYWSGAHYLGLGPAAHSYNGVSRQWNVANNALYISALNTDASFFEQEVLSRSDKINEYLMVNLRRIEGISQQWIKQNLTSEEQNNIADVVQQYPHHFICTANSIALSNAGKLFADARAADMFV